MYGDDEVNKNIVSSDLNANPDLTSALDIVMLARCNAILEPLVMPVTKVWHNFSGRNVQGMTGVNSES